ncbi:MAG: SDR family NAD(P)-dependent oxidoreductase [Vicinamibacterales bacterium]|nr:SDR family NAD(P)-dependent oxidoreductase [Vicinamibacterales bacterium]
MSGQAPVAVVTGGARRLGRHLCLRLAARGYDVVILYRRSDEAARALEQEIASTGRRARARAVDVGVEPQVAEAFAEIARAEGRVDLLVNNVGNYNPQPITRLTPAVWDATLAANLSGAYYCSFHALPLMPAHGSIINIGMAGLEGIRANVRGADYYVSKTGLLSLTRSLAVAYADRHIRVNMVSPGQLDNSVDLPPPDQIGETVPLGRAGELQDVAQAVEYLLDASYVTGANIDVAGGYRL